MEDGAEGAQEQQNLQRGHFETDVDSNGGPHFI